MERNISLNLGNIYFGLPLLFVISLVACSDKSSIGEATSPIKEDPAAITLSASDTAPEPEPDQLAPTEKHFVGAQSCQSCHSEQYTLWQNSHHDLAMQEANEETVLGNFENARHDYFGTISTFYKKTGRYFVKTDGPDGSLQDYAIAYTFGVYPLQQYLIEFPGGKLQALNVVWDSRSKEEGGQRWYHLYPNEHIKHDDELHWTGINQNWNFMCADCHSTNLQKNYDHASQSYATSWSEIDVSCEACHGPGSAHLAWAENPETASPDKGLALLKTGRDFAWQMDAATGNAKPQTQQLAHSEIASCAQCHSRRSTAFPHAQAGDNFLDHFRPALLEENLYHADGQINDEVYVWGSFVQSKMFQAGVTCSNCHEPHSLELRAEGDAVCAQCHMPQKYAVKDHHLHDPLSEAARCVSCHMPEKNFMVVDARRDHSMRVPRPDLSDTLGTPNVCTSCHADKSNSWAANILQNKNGEPPAGHYAEALFAARNGWPNAEALLVNLITDKTQPTIARATAVSLLPDYLSQQSAPLLQMSAYDEEPFISFALARVLGNIPQQYRAAFAVPLLYDEHRVTRTLAADSLVGVSLEQFPAETQSKYRRALDEHLVSENFNVDRPESLTNLADLHFSFGEVDKALAYYKEAIAIGTCYTPAYINYADTLRQMNLDSEGQAVLEQALLNVGDKSTVNHSLGLMYVRQKQMEKALSYLKSAMEGDKTNARYLYVYAIALDSTGQSQTALEILEKGGTLFPANPDILSALVSMYRDKGDEVRALLYEKQLHSI